MDNKGDVDSFDENYILEIFYKIEEDKKSLSKNDIQIKYKDFKDKYPKLFLSMLDGIFNKQQFMELVDIRRKTFAANKNKNHKIKKFESDINVSEHLARKYLYPVMGEPSEKQKREAYKKSLAKFRLSK